MQSGTGKQDAEKMLKKINEAYEILGNQEKRKEYEKERRERNKQEELEKQKNQIYQQYYNDTKTTENYDNRQYNDKNAYSESNEYPQDNNEAYENMKQEMERQKEELRYRQEQQEEINRQYQNAYEDYLRSLGYKVKHKWTKEDYKNFFITIGIIIVVCAILWIIPPIRNAIINFYEQNPILKAIVDVIIATITGIFRGIFTS